MAHGTPEREAAFAEWLNARGFQLSGCRVASVGNADESGVGARGVVCVGGVAAGHVLFRVPADAVLAAETCQIGTQIAAARLKGFNALIAAITCELYSVNSRWREYLDVLPQELDTPLFWSHEELKLLRGTRVDARANAENVSRVYSQVMRPFYESHKDYFPTAESRSFDTYRRVGAIALAYSFSPGGSCSRAVMLPMADQLNARPIGTSAHLFYADSEGSFEMQAIRDIEDGEEILNTYGARPNSELLLRYGYVSKPNPSNAIAFSAEELFSAWKSRQDSLGDCGGVSRARTVLAIRFLRRRGDIPPRGKIEDEPFAISEALFPVTLTDNSNENGEDGVNVPACGSLLSVFGSETVRITTERRLRMLDEAERSDEDICLAIASNKGLRSFEVARTRRRIHMAKVVRRLEKAGLVALRDSALRNRTAKYKQHQDSIH